MSLRKSLPALLAIAVVGLAACLPQPEEEIEWVRRENAVIVQMRLVGGDTMVYTSDREPLPAFTLYGDSTLIVSEMTEDCGTVESDPCSARLLQSHVSDDATQDLLDFIDATGFFNFDYEQPQPPVSGAPTTYLYVNAKLTANAVRVNALGWEAEDNGEWREFRRLGTIADRLRELQENAIATSSPFAPREGMLAVVPRVATDLVGVPEWPYPDIALPANAPEDDVTRVLLSAEQLASMALVRPNETMCWKRVQSGGRLYDVCYRPILPYEEHFPEFEGAQ